MGMFIDGAVLLLTVAIRSCHILSTSMKQATSVIQIRFEQSICDLEPTINANGRVISGRMYLQTIKETIMEKKKIKNNKKRACNELA
jgi:hypothetical protein